MLKTNAVAKPLLESAVGSLYMVAIATQYGLQQCSKTSAGAHKGRCANGVVIRGIYTKISLKDFSVSLGLNINPSPMESCAKTSCNKMKYISNLHFGEKSVKIRPKIGKLKVFNSHLDANIQRTCNATRKDLNS